MTDKVTKAPVVAETPAPAATTPDLKKTIDLVIAAVRKEFGKDAICRLSEMEDIAERVPTGVPELDAFLGGGFPRAVLVQLVGAESVGKSTFCNFLAAVFQRAGISVNFIDGEMSEDRDRAEDIGVNPDLVTLSAPDTLEAAFAIMDVMVTHFKQNGKETCVMLDSVAAFPLMAELERAFDDPSRPGVRAAFLSSNLGKLVRKLSGTKIGMVFVNQLREKIGAAPFEKPTYSPGGRALRHWSHVTLEMKRMGQLKERGEVVGIKSRLRVEKSKLNGIKPTTQIDLKLYFDGRVVLDEGESDA